MFEEKNHRCLHLAMFTFTYVNKLCYSTHKYLLHQYFKFGFLLLNGASTLLTD